uniref:Uncharacterized protein n=1 Tax=Anopheles coluzzii TaxID=1518534 RepID=A0A8W7PFS7_ANOCL
MSNFSFPPGGLVRACQPIHEHSHMHGDTAVNTPARYSRPERTRFSTGRVRGDRGIHPGLFLRLISLNGPGDVRTGKDRQPERSRRSRGLCVWHQLNHFENGFDCHPIWPWMAWLCDIAPIVVPMCSRQSAQRGNGFLQCGQEDSLCMVVAFPRRRASSCSAIETFLPQKLHNKNTDRELRGGDRMLPSVMSSWDRCSHKPHTSSMSRYVAIQYCTR